MFDKTTEELAEWAGRELKMGNYVRRAIETKSAVGVLIQPVRPAPDAQGVTDQSAVDLYKEELKQFVTLACKRCIQWHTDNAVRK